MKPRLLDLFCGAGGAAMGYHRAGFEVVGVDIKPQPHYPFEFHQADALEYQLEGFDAYHASPPCQGYCSHTKDNSQWVSYSQGKQTPRLIPLIRQRLLQSNRPFVIENVTGAKFALNNPFILCGVMFGLVVPRHRYFESSVPISTPEHCYCRGIATSYAQRNGIEVRDMSITGKGRHAGCGDRWRKLMEITWPMSQSEIVEAIPPAYTEFIGKQLLKGIADIEQGRIA